MTDITWVEQSHGFIDAAGADGNWSIIPYDVAKIGYTPALPGTRGINSDDDADRLLYAKAFDEMMAHPGREDRTEEYQRLAHFFGTGMTQGMFAETVEEAKLLISAMEAGDGDLAPCEDQLIAAGLSLKYPGHETLGNLWSIRIRSGSLDVSLNDTPGKRSIQVRFHGDRARFWHNVASVSVEQTGQSGVRILHAYPPSAKDPLKVGVAHVIRVMEMRLERGGRFSKPLGEVLKTG